MKIGLVLDDGLDAPDGVQQYILTVGTWLSKQGHEVHYLVGQTVRDDIKNLHSLSKNVDVRFNRNRLSIPVSASGARLDVLLQEQKFDVLHVQLPYSPQLAGKMLRRVSDKTAVVGTFHILPYGRLQSFGSRVLAKIVSKTLARFDTIVAVSTAARDFAKSRMGIEASVLPNAVNLAAFSEGKKLKQFDDGRQNVVFLGRLVERKGAMQLLQAVAVLYKRGDFRNRRLIIAGHGPQRPKLDAFIAKHNLQDSVVMAGWLTEADKPNYLKTATVAVLPSMSGESFGIVLVEAIASGAGVVLAGDNPGYRYVMDNNEQTLVDPLDTKEFANKLQKLLDNESLRKSLRDQQIAHIESYDIGVVGPQLEKLYRLAIAKRNHYSDNDTHEQ